MSEASNVQIIRCPNCGANNRVRKNEAALRTPICGRCQTSLAVETRPITVTDTNFADVMETSPLPVLLDLWAPWCGPCRMLAPIIDRIAEETAGQVQVGKLNVDENPNTAARFRVQGIPTLIILKNGREVDRIVGAQSREVILNRLQAFL
jgi:thioredoxin 2